MSRDRLQDNELVTDARGNVGRVIRCTNRQTKETYLRVKVLRGPNIGEWLPAYRFSASRDYPGGQLPKDCARCGNAYKTTPERFREPFCRSCSGDQQDRPGDRESWIGSDAWKRRHLPRGSKA